MKMFKEPLSTIPLLIVILLCLCKINVGFTRFRRTIKDHGNETRLIGDCHSVKRFFDSQNITIATLDEPLGNADSEYFIVILPFFCRHCFSWAARVSLTFRASFFHSFFSEFFQGRILSAF